MKKIYLLLATFMSLFLGQTYAQVSSYVFSQSSGTYTPITGTLVAEATEANPTATPDSGPMDDFTFTNIPIGFNFKFNGSNYTSLNANTNGWISFGPTSTSTGSPLSSTNAYNGVIAASAFDLMGVYATSATRTLGSNVLTDVANTTFCRVGKAIQGAGIPAGSTITAFDATTITISNAATASSTGTYVSFATGEIRTEVTGVAPNRTFTIQLSGFAQYSTTLSATTNNTYLEFQVKLTEGGSNGDQAGISIVYGNYYRVGGSSTAQVGLRGIVNTDYNNRATTTDWSATTAGVANSNTSTFSSTVFPTSGLTFSWAQSPIFVDYCNIQFPPNATIALGGSEIIYTQGYEPGVTEAPGAGAGISVWIATNGANTDPATWPLSAWVPATFNVQVGNNDEFSLAIGANLGAGTHYYASRWLLTGGQFRYGGYSAPGGGYWDGTNNVSGVLTVTPTVANDICSGAIMLTVNADLACGTSTAGTTVGASQSPELPAPTCSATGINDDVWYSFVATGASHVVTLTGATNITAAQVYGGSCGSLTTIACGSTSSGTANITAQGLVSGNTYLVRVYSTSTAVGTTSDFNICIGTPPLPPANDECSGAVMLTVNADLACGTSTPGTTLSATQSTELPAPTCNATGINDDVWYSFVATGASHVVTLTGATNITAAQVYGGSCGSLTTIACGSTSTGTANITAQGLVSGNTYLVRVYSTSTVVGTISEFSICIGTPPAPPANDECSNAIGLTVNADLACGTSTLGTTISATQSAETPAPTCSATGINDDVWYSFVATDAIHVINITGATNTTAAQVYSGTCGSLATVVCGSTSSGTANVTATGLTSGNTYLVRVYSTSSTVGTSSSFTICIGTPPPPPANDDCLNATVLTVNADLACAVTTSGTTLSATQSAETPAPTCSATGINDDVWYSFVATNASHVINITGATNTTAAQVYSGTCGSLATVVCGSTVSGTANVTATGLTIGDTYLVRVYSTSSVVGTSSNFTICVGTLPPPPANDECSNATVISSTPVSASTVSATQSQPATICGTFTSPSANDVWFQFTALSSGDATVTVSNAAGGIDPVIQGFSGSCGALTNIGCADATFGNGNEVLILNGLTAGQTYFIQVYGYSTSRGTFDITVTGAALPISVEYFRGTKQTNGNLLDWKVTCYNSPTVKMEVERSADGRRFNTIQTQTETALRCLQPFSFADTDPLAGINYYRLKSTDVDGKITYSATVAILNKTKGFEIVSMIPNPVETCAILSISSAVKATMEIVVTDLAGKQLSKQRVVLIAGSNQVPLNLSKLAAGTYQVTGITDEGERKSVRFVKQ